MSLLASHTYSLKLASAHWNLAKKPLPMRFLMRCFGSHCTNGISDREEQWEVSWEKMQLVICPLLSCEWEHVTGSQATCPWKRFHLLSGRTLPAGGAQAASSSLPSSDLQPELLPSRGENGRARACVIAVTGLETGSSQLSIPCKQPTAKLIHKGLLNFGMFVLLITAGA